MKLFCSSQSGREGIACCLIVLAVVLCASVTAEAQDEIATSLSVPSSAMTGASPAPIDAPIDLFPLGHDARLAKNFPGTYGNTSSVLSSESPSEPQRTTDPTQRQIERDARRLQAGVRAGVGLDPELIMLGVQAQFGPIFRSNVSFRPSLEFGIGEVTAMFGFNAEFIYNMPRSSAQDNWAPYFGGGLGVNLLHQHFENEEDGRRIDFGDFHSDTALNILGGMRARSGLFFELRTSVYSQPSPTLRLMVGYHF